MSVLSDLRSDLRDKLTDAGLHAFTITPEKVSPPFVAVSPDDPYVAFESDAGLSYGEVLVRHRLVLVAAQGANDVRADELDALIIQVLGLDLSPHVVESVDEPGSIAVNGQKCLGVAVNLSVPIRL